MWQVVAVTWLQEHDLGCELGDYQIVKYQDIAAIITRSCCGSLERLEMVDRVDALFNYQSILERASINRTIIPIQFGTMVKTKKDIVYILEKNLKKFKSLLKYARGKTEFDLMGIWKERIGNINKNIFEVLEEKGLEVKPHKPGNRAICFHVSVLIPDKQQETFAIIKEDISKTLGNDIDVRISEPLPPFNFFTVDVKEMIAEMEKHKIKIIKKD